MKVNSLYELVVALNEGPLYYTCNSETFAININKCDIERVNLDRKSSHNTSRGKFCNFVAFLISYQIELSHTKPILKYALVIAWQNKMPLNRTLGFYREETDEGSRSHRVDYFTKSKKSHYLIYDNIEEIPTNPETGLYDGVFAWANQAIEKLKKLDK